MNVLEEKKTSKSHDAWNTIDDVMASLDSLSLINRGRPTTPLEFPPDVFQQEENEFIKNFNQSDIYDDDCTYDEEPQPILERTTSFENSASNGVSIGRGKFIKELNKYQIPTKDAILRTELSQVIPHNFSNEYIEKYWNNTEDITEDTEEGQFDGAKLTDLNEVVNEYSQNYYLESQENEVLARACSPPFVASSSSSGSPFQHAGDNVQSNNINSMDMLENISSDDERVIQSSFEEKLQTAPIVRPRKCRNALLNGLIRKGQLSNEILTPPVLKTPNDFLNSTTCNEVETNYETEESNTQQLNGTLHNEFNSNTAIVNFKIRNCEKDFEFKDLDFPAL